MTDAPIHFATAAAFRRWLRAHHTTADHLVVRIAKAHALSSGIGYAEALDEALCVGWIDGVRRSLDADAFSIRFTPRRPRSIWSLVNVAHVERLMAAGRMQPAGLAAFAARTPERTGIYSFEQEPGDGYRRDVLLDGEVWDGTHRRALLGAEVLDDHLLDVPVASGGRRHLYALPLRGGDR